MIIKQIFTEPETEVKWYFDSIEEIHVVIVYIRNSLLLQNSTSTSYVRNVVHFSVQTGLETASSSVWITDVFQFRIFTAPFHFVNFADFWLADQLNSLSCVLLDLEFLVCYYAMEVDWLGDDSKQVTGPHSIYLFVVRNLFDSTCRGSVCLQSLKQLCVKNWKN